MKKITIGITIALTLLLSWALVIRQHTNQSSPSGQGGDFILQSTSGPVALHDFKGRVVVLYFGYTSCPDICPTSLGFTSQALTALDKTELGKVQMLFVTVDPGRDTLEKLKSYTAYFHPNIMGLSGTPEAIAKAAKLYGAAYAKQDTGSAGGYVVDHSAYTYIIAPDGKLFKTLDHGTPPAQVVETIRAAMKKG